MMENNSDKPKSNQSHILFAYITGFLAATAICGVIFLFVAYKAGFSTNLSKLGNILSSSKSYKTVMRLPDDLLAELTLLKAPIENADNPTKLTEHQTYLTHLDDELGYVLNPDINVSVNLLKSTKALNVDPPSLHLQASDISHISTELKSYIQQESRLDYAYSTDSEGFRRTVPRVESDKQILVIGDSVAFGVGVDDENTVASHLQKMVGKEYQIINAGVGGYSGHQAFLRAKQLSDGKKYIGLIYIACQNDFMGDADWTTTARDTLTELNSISDRFNNNITVMFETYMEYNLRDIFLELGWSDRRIEKTHTLRKDLPGIVAQFGFEYHDWTDTVQNFMMREKSIFSRFALYSDHAHLSPLGSRLMAGELFSIIQEKWSCLVDDPRKPNPHTLPDRFCFR